MGLVKPKEHGTDLSFLQVWSQNAKLIVREHCTLTQHRYSPVPCALPCPSDHYLFIINQECPDLHGSYFHGTVQIWKLHREKLMLTFRDYTALSKLCTVQITCQMTEHKDTLTAKRLLSSGDLCSKLLCIFGSILLIGHQLFFLFWSK